MAVGLSCPLSALASCHLSLLTYTARGWPLNRRIWIPFVELTFRAIGLVGFKPRLHEQFLCDNFYLTTFICWGKPRLHEQFLCEKFYLLASLHKQFLFENKKKMPILYVVSSTRTIFCMWQFLFAHKLKTNTPVFQQI